MAKEWLDSEKMVKFLCPEEYKYLILPQLIILT